MEDDDVINTSSTYIKADGSIAQRPFSPKLKSLKSCVLTDKDFKEIANCRYIRKSPRQRKDNYSVERIESFLEQTTVYNNIKEEEDDDDEFDENDNISINKDENIEEYTKELTVISAVAPLSPRSPLPPKSPVPRLPLLAKRKPFDNHQSIKPNIQLTSTVVYSSSLNRSNIDHLQEQFSEKCLVSNPKSINSEDDKITTTTTAKRPKRKETKKIRELYEDISSAAKNVNIDIDDVIRDVKDKRERLRVIRAVRDANKGLKKWSFLAKLVRSGFLIRKESTVLNVIKKNRKLRKAAGVYGRSASLTPLPPLSSFSLGNSSKFRRRKTADNSFGAPRRASLKVTKSLPISSELPQIASLTQSPASYRRGSSFI